MIQLLRMSEVCSVPVKFTFKQQEILRNALDFPLRLFIPFQKRSQDIERFSNNYRLRTTSWYIANADDCTTDSLQECMRRLQPQRICITESDAKRSFQAFAKISPEVLNLLDHTTAAERTLTSRADRWDSFRIGDMWILTSLLFRRWPEMLMEDCERIWTWLGFVGAKLIFRAGLTGANTEDRWEVARDRISEEVILMTTRDQ